MAKMNSGIFGPFSGRVDNIIGYRRKSKSIITGRRIDESILQLQNLKTQNDRMNQFWNHYQLWRPVIEKFLVDKSINFRLTSNELLFQNYNNAQLDNTLVLAGFSYIRPNSPFIKTVSGIVNTSTKIANVTFSKYVFYRDYFNRTDIENPIVVTKPQGYNNTTITPVDNIITTGGSFSGVAVGRARGRAIILRTADNSINHGFVLSLGVNF